jgi:hypothetical protein
LFPLEWEYQGANQDQAEVAFQLAAYPAVIVAAASTDVSHYLRHVHTEDGNPSLNNSSFSKTFPTTARSLRAAMDPFAALGAAAAIAQFVQLGVSLVSKAYDTYSSASGMPRADEQLGFVIGELSTVSKSIISEKPAWQQTDAGKSLAIVAEKCLQLSEKILRILERTKADNPRSKRQSAVAALRSLWNEKEKKELKKDADDCRNLLHLQLTSIMGFV